MKAKRTVHKADSKSRKKCECCGSIAFTTRCGKFVGLLTLESETTRYDWKPVNCPDCLAAK